MVTTIRDRFRLAALALLGDSKAVTAVSARVVGAGQNLANFMPFNYRNVAKHGYAGNETAYSGIRTLVDSFSEAPMVVLDAAGTEIQNHWFTQVMRRPNRFRSQSQLWEATVLPWFLCGNAFWEVVRNKYTGRPVEFWPMRPDRVKIIPSAETFIAGYTYNILGHDYPLAVEDVIHFKFENPMDDYWGMSPLLPAFSRIDGDNEQAKIVKTVLENGAVPGLAVMLNRAFENQAEADRWYQKWEQRFSGNGRGRVAAMSEASDIKTIGMDFDKMAVKDLSQMTEAKILSCIGTPPIMTGASVGLENATYANAEGFRLIFWENTISTLHNAAADTIQSRLYDDLGAGETPRFDGSKVPALRSIRNAEQTAFLNEVQQGVRTVNEYRATRGLAALPEGDVLYKPASQQVLDSLARLTAPPPAEVPVTTTTPETPAAKSSTPAAPTPPAPCGCGCGGTTHAPKETPAPRQLKTLERDGRKVRVVLSSRKVAANHQGLANAAQHLGRVSLAKKFSDRFKQWAKSEFAHQAATIKACLTEPKKSAKGTKASSDTTTPAQLDQVTIEMAGWTDHALGTVEDMMIELQTAARLATAKELGIEYAIENTGIAQAKTHAYKFAQAISKTSADDVRAIFVQARADELTTEGIRAALMDKFDEWDSVRADTVARTETIRSTNAATVDAYRDAGIEEMVWTTTGSACEYCEALDGVIVSIGDPFFRQGDRFAPTITTTDEDGNEVETTMPTMKLDYEAVETPPLHPCCECTITAQLAEE
jgi:HK97 family phage portal protein